MGLSCDALRCSGPHTRYTEVIMASFSQFFPLREERVNC